MCVGGLLLVMGVSKNHQLYVRRQGEVGVDDSKGGWLMLVCTHPWRGQQRVEL